MYKVTERRLMFNGKDYGLIGEWTKYEDFYVGDVVKFHSSDKENHFAVIAWDAKLKRYSALGYFKNNISELELEYAMNRVMSYEVFDFIPYQEMTGRTIDSLETEVTYLTKKEVEKELGYIIKITE